MAEVEKLGPRDRRIVKHITQLTDAGTDVLKFAAAVREVRDDPGLTSAQREAIWKTLAQDAAQAYFYFASGRPLNLPELLGIEEPKK